MMHLPETQGELARAIVEMLTETVPDASLPWYPSELEAVNTILNKTFGRDRDLPK